MKTLAVLVAMSVGLAVAGCGGTELDSKKLEEALPHDLAPVVSSPIKSASCPSGVDVEKGKKFSCEIVLANGKTETAHLKLTNDNADYEFLSLSPNK
jgi:hypothetical protein